jgi:hypothetical protein
MADEVGAALVTHESLAAGGQQQVQVAKKKTKRFRVTDPAAAADAAPLAQANEGTRSKGGSSAPVVKAGPDPLEVENVSATIQAHRQHLQCSCLALLPKAAPFVQGVALKLGFDIKVRYTENGSRKTRVKRKNELILEICPKCITADDQPGRQPAAGQEGVGREFWEWTVSPGQLSIVDAFHLRLGQDIERLQRLDFGGREAAEEVHRFRAHMMKHLGTNWNYYVVRGRSNYVDSEFLFFFSLSFLSGAAPGPGSVVVENRSNRILNFCLAMRHTCDGHYCGLHSPVYCGRLRSDAGVCTPFQLFGNCAPAVMIRVKAALDRVLEFVAVRVHLDSISAPYADQDELRAHFQLNV